MDNIPDYQIEVNIYTMKHIRLFEYFRVGLTPDTEDTPENITYKRAVIEDFCDKYDFKLVTDYNCFEIHFRDTTDEARKNPINSQQFKVDLIKFFKKLSANHKREDVDRFDMDILKLDGFRSVTHTYSNLFNKDNAEELYRYLDNVDYFSLLKLDISVRFTYRYY